MKLPRNVENGRIKNTKELIKYSIKLMLRSIGWKLSRYPINSCATVELDKADIDLIKHVLDCKYTMTSFLALENTLKSFKYCVENNIPGDFVECGIWRSGNGIVAKKTFEKLGSEKTVWMLDTFAGMTEPESIDISAESNESAKYEFTKNQREFHNAWCHASLEEVMNNPSMSGIDIESVNFIKGDVCEKLNTKENLPGSICVLRLDTDWYKSTKYELETLHPILERRGVLIIDDYGYWEDSRKAVDECFAGEDYKPMLSVVENSVRIAIKL